MKLIEAQSLMPSALPGIHHVTRASHLDGLATLSVWQQTMQPGGATPPHTHDCDEVVMCTAGEGEVRSGDQVLRFTAGCTLALPAHEEHQIFNTGSGPLATIGIFSATPVVTRDLAGAALELPWQS